MSRFSSISPSKVLTAVLAAFVFFSMLSVTATRPIETATATAQPTRNLKQFNSTQRTGPWFPITGTTASSMPGYFPRLNLTRNASASGSQVALSTLPDPNALKSSFPGQSFRPPPTVRSGNSGLQSTGGLDGVANFDGTPIVIDGDGAPVVG